MVTIHSTLPDMDLHNARVFLRADLNVQLNSLNESTDYRLQTIIPTIRLIQEKGGKVILATHIGRPQGHTYALSTQHLIPWFQKHGFSVEFEADLAVAHTKSFLDNNTILLLENLRFFAGEQSQSKTFAAQLAQLGDFYVNDAFALLHRHDTSITITPCLFSPEKRTIGLLIAHELMMLNKLLYKPARPFVVACGGGKVSDKILLLKALLPHVQTILLCPAIVFTFLSMQGKPVGSSLVDKNSFDVCKQFLSQAEKLAVKIVYPVDYIVAAKTFNGPLQVVLADEFPADAVGISIGPKTGALFAQEILQAKTIFYNGAMGDIARPETLQGIGYIFNAMKDSRGFSVVGGGESVAAAHLLQLNKEIDYLSTGGGSTLAYLSGEKLPGLSCFLPT